MPRYRPAPAPHPADLRSLPLHVLLRDWPEMDPVLREVVPRPDEVGHLSLPEAVGGTEASEEVLVRRLEAATSWRPPPNP